MKEILLSLVLVVTGVLALAQDADSDFETSKYCTINVNDPTTHFGSAYRRPAINATVKWTRQLEDGEGRGDCSATLINRNTADGDVAYYLITARHCVTEVDFDAEHFLYFNYQSPDENTASTPQTNWGWLNEQSNLGVNPAVASGYEYFHRTRMRLVTNFFWGDFALVEILTPIPPHFNFTYAGWNPSRFYNGVQIGTTELPYDLYAGIHHPRGDIKKISTANNINWLENPVATGCYTITTIIDVLFGWIWGNSVSTPVICNYIDNPYLNIAWNPFGNGITEGGSSGSGLFNTANRHIGQLSFSITGTWCDFPVIDQYGKLHANYSNQAVKNTLNPSHTVAVDLFGIGSRKITCYNNLELPGAPSVSGQYFPANHYGDNNLVVLSSQNNITTTQPIHIYPGAEYTFQAAGAIDIGPGFQVDPGATFNAQIGNCASVGSRELDPTAEARAQLRQIRLPKKLVYTAPDSIVFAKNTEGFSVSLSPNPNAGIFTLESAQADDYQVRVMDVLGHLIHQSSFQGTATKIDVTGTAPGIYVVVLTNGTETQQMKMVIQ